MRRQCVEARCCRGAATDRGHPCRPRCGVAGRASAVTASCASPGTAGADTEMGRGGARARVAGNRRGGKGSGAVRARPCFDAPRGHHRLARSRPTGTPRPCLTGQRKDGRAPHAAHQRVEADSPERPSTGARACRAGRLRRGGPVRPPVATSGAAHGWLRRELPRRLRAPQRGTRPDRAAAVTVAARTQGGNPSGGERERPPSQCAHPHAHRTGSGPPARSPVPSETASSAPTRLGEKRSNTSSPGCPDHAPVRERNSQREHGRPDSTRGAARDDERGRQDRGSGCPEACTSALGTR